MRPRRVHADCLRFHSVTSRLTNAALETYLPFWAVSVGDERRKGILRASPAHVAVPRNRGEITQSNAEDVQSKEAFLNNLGIGFLLQHRL